MLKRTTVLWAIPLALAIVSILGCSEGTSSISGTVVMGEEVPEGLGGFPGGPVSGVRVFIPGTSWSAVTDENGKYIIEDVPAGTYTLKLNLLYLTVAETEIQVKAGELTVVPDLEISIPAFFLGDWEQVGFYDKETNAYIGDQYVHMGPDPTITQMIRGELRPLGNETYLDETISLTINVNNTGSVPVELRKNIFSYKIETTLLPGENTIVLEATNPKGSIRTRTLFLYYYTSGLLLTLYWDKAGDLDLHLIGPGGTDCSYDNTNPDWGVIEDSSDNPKLHRDRRSGWEPGRETIALPNPPAGDYTVKVHFFGYRHPPYREEPVRPSVTIYLDGEEYEFTAEKPMRADDEWQVTSFTLPGGTPKAPTTNVRSLSSVALPNKD